jgi:hypothetical protein
MARLVPWLRTHLVALAVVLTALVGMAGAFAFARPKYQPRVSIQTVRMSSEPHYTAAQVTDAFAQQGITLLRRSSQSGTTFFADKRPGAKDDAFLVTVFSPGATVGFGTSDPKPLYEKRVGNVHVSYGGNSTTFAARVARAAANIQR